MKNKKNIIIIGLIIFAFLITIREVMVEGLKENIEKFNNLSTQNEIILETISNGISSDEKKEIIKKLKTNILEQEKLFKKINKFNNIKKYNKETFINLNKEIDNLIISNKAKMILKIRLYIPKP